MNNEFDYLKIGGVPVYASDVEARRQIQAMGELMNAQTEFTLEQNSSPLFSRSNPYVAQVYASMMDGYLFLVKDGQVYAAKLNSGSGWTKFDDGTTVSAAMRAATETMIHVPDCYYLGNEQT